MFINSKVFSNPAYKTANKTLKFGNDTSPKEIGETIDFMNEHIELRCAIDNHTKKLLKKQNISPSLELFYDQYLTFYQDYKANYLPSNNNDEQKAVDSLIKYIKSYNVQKLQNLL